jgi:glutaredoxin 2
MELVRRIRNKMGGQYFLQEDEAAQEIDEFVHEQNKTEQKVVYPRYIKSESHE